MTDAQVEHGDLFGRRITVRQSWWAVHVLENRPWMAGWESHIAATLRKPEIITQDKNHENRECYYRVGVPIDAAMMLKVVVEFDENGAGTLITAFPTRRVPRKEKELWPQPDITRHTPIE